MQFLLVMILPAICCICGGGLVTDEVQSRRTIGFVLVAIGVLLIATLIVVQIMNPQYYYPPAA